MWRILAHCRWAYKYHHCHRHHCLETTDPPRIQNHHRLNSSAHTEHTLWEAHCLSWSSNSCSISSTNVAQTTRRVHPTSRSHFKAQSKTDECVKECTLEWLHPRVITSTLTAYSILVLQWRLVVVEHTESGGGSRKIWRGTDKGKILPANVA